uniref:Histidine ammonia-lyase n=1 Tax=Paramormyrops kingsleyae TaxID=1676925 RepID=A0A3B3T4F3_9TELE
MPGNSLFTHRCRFAVCVSGGWWTVPCRDPSSWASAQRGGFTLRTCRCKRRLDQNASIGDVLEDNSFVELGKGFLGSPLSPEQTQMLLVLKINMLARGHSGISTDTIQKMIEAFSASCLPSVPEKVTVGGSGDLAPLAHLTLGLMGKGMMWSPKSAWADAKYVMKAHGLTPISPKLKTKIVGDFGVQELALIKGIQLITSLGAEAVEIGQTIARQADIIASLTVEVLQKTSKALKRGEGDPLYLVDQIANLHCACLDCRKWVNGGHESLPEMHGFANDTIAFVKRIISTEMNNSTDNLVISGGNFHGEYPAKVRNFWCLMCEGAFSNCLHLYAHPVLTWPPAVSESKALCHPASLESLSTSPATEDHMSMGGWATRKALRAVEHLEQVLAIALLTACQGLELSRPKKTTGPLEHVYNLVRSSVQCSPQFCETSLVMPFASHYAVSRFSAPERPSSPCYM